MIGTNLSHFRITAKLGEGGMGEVYEAWDESLERPVALKILPPEVVRDPDRVRRFVQEAKSASALSHPHIVTIYEIGEATPETREGESTSPEAQDLGTSRPAVHFIAMERIDGSTLKSKIHVEQAAPKDLLRWLGQAAEGLAKAHAEGIVHRDLKPDNIMVTGDGYAKVLDFGLAKLTESLSEISGTHMPTMVGEQTAEGAVMGTVGYMSPEQVQGKRVDQRTDIFSFGCLLYEAMTRQRPFAGETAVDTMHQILRAQPVAVRELSPETPAAVRRVIRRCLAKDPDRRFQSMKDLALGLADLVEEWDELASRSDSVGSSASGSLAPISEPDRHKRWLGLAAVVIIAALLALAVVQFIRSSNPPPVEATQPVAAFSRITQQPGIETEPSLSPDGRYVTYVSDAGGEDDIYLQRVGGRNPVNLTEGSGADDEAPAFSPDGEQIAFASDRDGGGIFLMGATGESVRRLTDFGFNPTWSPDGGKIAFATEGHADPYGRTAMSELWVVELAGGEPRRLSAGDAMQPNWSPDGRRIAFWGLRDMLAGGAQREIGTVPAEGGEPVWVTDDAAVDWSPAWSPDSGWLYFISDRGGSANIWRIAIDKDSGEALAAPRPLTAPSRLVSHIALSRDGTQIVFTDENISSNVARVELDRSGGGVPVPVTRGSSEFVQPEASPDGEWVAFRSAGGQEDLYVARADGSELLQLTDDAFKDRRPTWSSDGERILFYSDRSGRYEFFAINRDGSGLEQLTESEGDSFFYPRWSPDGKRICATNSNSSALWDLASSLPARDFEPLPPIDGSGRFLFDPEWSPDGTRLSGLVLQANQPPSSSEGLAIYSLATGDYEMVFEPESGSGIASQSWTSDGRRILLDLRRADDRRQLAELDLTRGTLEELWTAPEGASLLRPTADGRAVFFEQGVDEVDLWLATLE